MLFKTPDQGLKIVRSQWKIMFVLCGALLTESTVSSKRKKKKDTTRHPQKKKNNDNDVREAKIPDVGNAYTHVSIMNVNFVKLLVLVDKCLHCSQEPRYRYTSGPGQPSEHAVLQVAADHEAGTTVAERGEESTRISASDLQRL